MESVYDLLVSEQYSHGTDLCMDCFVTGYCSASKESMQVFRDILLLRDMRYICHLLPGWIIIIIRNCFKRGIHVSMIVRAVCMNTEYR